LNGYVPQMLSYTPPDYELYHPDPAHLPVNGGPPIPMPQSALPFPLDPTRSCLLGQLEYYLSPQNMAQDFFLRQRVRSTVDGNLMFLTIPTCYTDG
jgi:la-related protein 1